MIAAVTMAGLTYHSRIAKLEQWVAHSVRDKSMVCTNINIRSINLVTSHLPMAGCDRLCPLAVIWRNKVHGNRIFCIRQLPALEEKENSTTKIKKNTKQKWEWERESEKRILWVCGVNVIYNVFHHDTFVAAQKNDRHRQTTISPCTLAICTLHSRTAATSAIVGHHTTTHHIATRRLFYWSSRGD